MRVAELRCLACGDGVLVFDLEPPRGAFSATIHVARAACDACGRWHRYHPPGVAFPAGALQLERLPPGLGV